MVGVVGVDGQARDRHACEEVAADVRPGEPAVHRLEDAIAKVAVAGQGAFTGAVVDDHVVGRGHNERARRQRWEVVGPVRPQPGDGVGLSPLPPGDWAATGATPIAASATASVRTPADSVRGNALDISTTPNGDPKPATRPNRAHAGKYIQARPKRMSSSDRGCRDDCVTAA